jgi:hypothetical protein
MRILGKKENIIMRWYYKFRYSPLMTRYVLITDIKRLSQCAQMEGTRRQCFRAGKKYGGNWMVQRYDVWLTDFRMACGDYEQE